VTIGNRSVALKRRLTIADLVRREGEVRVEDLSGRLKVSTVTIRSDLNYLELEGLLSRQFGKAVSPSRELMQGADEAAVADRARYRDLLTTAADLLASEQSIFVGRGSLPLRLIPHLGDIPDLSLTVSSLDAVAVARSCIDCEIHVLGGRVDQDGSTLTGNKALQHLRNEIVGAFVFEADAIELGAEEGRGPGFVFGSHGEASFAAAACEQSARSMVLVRSIAVARDTGAASLGIGQVHDLVFPAAPVEDCSAYLKSAGYTRRNIGSVVAYSRLAVRSFAGTRWDDTP